MKIKTPFSVFNKIALIVITTLLAQGLQANYKLYVGVAPVKHDASTILESPSPKVSTSKKNIYYEDDFEEELEPIVIDIEAEEKEPIDNSLKNQTNTGIELNKEIRKPNFGKARMEIRKAEALALQNYLSRRLKHEGRDLFAEVINAPIGTSRTSLLGKATDLWVELTIMKADHREIVLKVNATTSAYETLIKDKIFKHKITPEDFLTPKRTLREAYGQILKKVALDVIDKLQRKLVNKSLKSYNNWSNLQFANQIAPSIFPEKRYIRKGFLGRKSIKSLPAEEDPNFKEAIEARLSTLEAFQRFDELVVNPGRKEAYVTYATWRYRSFLAAKSYQEAKDEIKELNSKNQRAILGRATRDILLIFGASEIIKKTGIAESGKKEKIATGAAVVGSLYALSRYFKVEDGSIRYNSERLAESDAEYARKFTERSNKILNLSVKSNEDAMKLETLQQSFSNDLAPVNIQYKGQSYSLSGQIEDKIARLKEILESDYQKAFLVE